MWQILLQIFRLASKYGPWVVGAEQALANGYGGKTGLQALIAYIIANPLPQVPPTDNAQLQDLAKQLETAHAKMAAAKP